MRLIIYSTLNGSREGVYFTEDFEMDANEILPPNCIIDSDIEIDGNDFPSSFPLNYNLERN